MACFKEKPAFKVFFLGDRGCGKSTIIRKLRLRLGDEITTQERICMRDAVYDDFITILDLLKATPNGIKIFKNCGISSIREFLDVLHGCPCADWTQNILRPLQRLVEDTKLREEVSTFISPELSIIKLISGSSQIFLEGWLPTCAQLLTYHTPTCELTRSVIKAKRLSLHEVPCLAINCKEMKKQTLTADLLVFVVDSSRQTGTANEDLMEIIRLRLQSGRFSHIIFNKSDLNHGNDTSEDEMISRLNDMISHIPPEHSNLVIHQICALNTMWMPDVLEAWSGITPKRLVG